MLAFVGRSGDGQQLYIRPIAGSDSDARAISGTAGALSPFWSSDGERLAFFADGSLKRARISGGTADIETISAAADGFFGASWGEADQILFAGSAGRLMRVLDGDAPRALMELGSRNGSTLRHVAGQVLYVDDGILWARPFDEDKLELGGEPRRIAGGFSFSGPGTAAVSVSRNGVLAYRTLPLTERAMFRWFERDGTPGETVGDPVYLDGFDLSPDGTELDGGVGRRDRAPGNARSARAAVQAQRCGRCVFAA